MELMRENGYFYLRERAKFAGARESSASCLPHAYHALNLVHAISYYICIACAGELPTRQLPFHLRLLL